MKPMTIEQFFEAFITDKGDIRWGLDTAMESIRPYCLYEVKAHEGKFTLTRWDDNQYEGPPSEQEIRDEYIRHKTIAECYEYFKDKLAK